MSTKSPFDFMQVTSHQAFCSLDAYSDELSKQKLLDQLLGFNVRMCGPRNKHERILVIGESAKAAYGVFASLKSYYDPPLLTEEVKPEIFEKEREKFLEGKPCLAVTSIESFLRSDLPFFHMYILPEIPHEGNPKYAEILKIIRDKAIAAKKPTKIEILTSNLESRKLFLPEWLLGPPPKPSKPVETFIINSPSDIVNMVMKTLKTPVDPKSLDIKSNENTLKSDSSNADAAPLEPKHTDTSPKPTSTSATACSRASSSASYRTADSSRSPSPSGGSQGSVLPSQSAVLMKSSTNDSMNIGSFSTMSGGSTSEIVGSVDCLSSHGLTKLVKTSESAAADTPSVPEITTQLAASSIADTSIAAPSSDSAADSGLPVPPGPLPTSSSFDPFNMKPDANGRYIVPAGCVIGWDDIDSDEDEYNNSRHSAEHEYIYDSDHYDDDDM